MIHHFALIALLLLTGCAKAGSPTSQDTDEAETGAYRELQSSNLGQVLSLDRSNLLEPVTGAHRLDFPLCAEKVIGKATAPGRLDYTLNVESFWNLNNQDGYTGLPPPKDDRPFRRNITRYVRQPRKTHFSGGGQPFLDKDICLARSHS